MKLTIQLLFLIYLSFSFTINILSKESSEANKSIHKRTLSLQEFINDNQAESDWYKVNKINHFLNNLIQYQDDQSLYGETDYWATVNETLESGQGDCEDYVIAKYFSLLALGVNASKLRLMYGRHLSLDQPHMVLLYFDEPQVMPLVLDNFHNDLLSLDKRDDFKPVYSFNDTGLWLVKVKNAEQRKSAKNYSYKVENNPGVSKWDDLAQRMASETKKIQVIH